MARSAGQRWTLVVLLAIAQVGCLVGAGLWFASLIEGRVDDLARARLGDTVEAIVVQAADEIDRTPAELREARMREIIDHTRVPHGGVVALVDTHGSIVHGPRDARWIDDEGTVLARRTVERGRRIGGGTVETDLVVAIPAERVAVASREFVERVRFAGIVIAIIVGVVLAAMSSVVVASYEARLATAHALLVATDETRVKRFVKTRDAVILGLAKLADSRDDQTGHHLERIRGYVRVLAEQLVGRIPEVTPEFVEILVETSALHDIGKVGLPDEILRHPGRLTPEQRKTLEKHTLIGGDTLLAVKRKWGDDQFLITACEVAFAHHERYDGTGYPFGLSGDVIPLSARIVALADVYDALTASRVYKKRFTHEEASDVINEGAGTHFDPVVVDAFNAVKDEFVRIRDRLDVSDATWILGQRPEGREDVDGE